jgi:alanine racemase
MFKLFGRIVGMRPTRAMINLSNLDHNIKELKKLMKPETCFMAVVKANAYGHGAIEVALQALDSGASWLGVATPEEGAELREAGVKAPILVLGGIYFSDVKTVVQYDLTQCIFTTGLLDSLNKEGARWGKCINIHLKLDTGMRRIGISCINELERFLAEVKQYSNLRLEGAFTHFAAADEPDKTFTSVQLERFKEMLNVIHKHNIRPKFVHAANSAAIIECPSTHFNLVRAGISMYGYYPSPAVNKTQASLLPVMQWETKILCIKQISQGDSISYGRTFYAPNPMKIATLPIGYADGYKRILSNKGHVLIDGIKAPVVGRICMDQMMVDVTHIPQAKPDDTAVLIGMQRNTAIDADYLANLSDTISYEILTSVSSRVRRVYVK